MKTLILIACAILITATTSHARWYKWVDENGKTHYSDKPPAQTTQVEVGQSSGAMGAQGHVRATSTQGQTRAPKQPGAEKKPTGPKEFIIANPYADEHEVLRRELKQLYRTPSHVYNTAKRNAEAQYPGNESRHEYEIKEQAEAYAKIKALSWPTTMAKEQRQVEKKAKKRYPEDYTMQLFLYESAIRRNS